MNTFLYEDMHIMHIAETSSTVVVDGLTGAQPKILSRVGKLPNVRTRPQPKLHFP